ncbi:Sensor histidine kinase RegB [Roseibaca ekhonensis]|jgi:two-component system sensor histidine kinase RegB|uniref:histidine kinase n=1 Tax=Roseinatronobacter ekhonensis TaxID=254356 RepID=A0A3B0MTY0_9RHOB|nr:ActS/PrrB/RegB family redox-sensitive histidine kinase [Roseibaca ekhonensis]SUZ31366.1 Sensor histidine kinase RegB [Roseibaca ekhonensis]
MDPTFGEITQDNRTEWVRLRTLAYVRLLALSGQIAALVVGQLTFGLRFDNGLVALVIGAAGVSILLSLFLYPAAKRLSDTEASLTFLFDIAQLSLLLYLTGGITNPFALLVMAPVAVAAMALRPRSTLLLSLVAIALITLVSITYRPLRFADGTMLDVAPILTFGHWAAIVIGIAFQAFYAQRVAAEANSMADALLAAQMALSREQKLTDLGGVVAATAHELGTPLATIKLVSAELAEELGDRPDLAEDARLLVQQADRCRTILQSMGRSGKDDTMMRRAPLEAVLHEAAEPHLDRGKQVHFLLQPGDGADDMQPLVQRRPELIHGLRNLIQNAVDFAASEVWVDASWTAQTLRIRIIDDGPGFSAQVLGSIGEPFIGRGRDPNRPKRRPGYAGMGLGMFIAKTLLERTGARLEFLNCDGQIKTLPGHPVLNGALIDLTWPLPRIAVDPTETLPQNAPVAN